MQNSRLFSNTNNMRPFVMAIKKKPNTLPIFTQNYERSVIARVLAANKNTPDWENSISKNP